MTNTFTRTRTSIGTLYFRESSKHAYAQNYMGTFVANSAPVQGEKLEVSLISNGILINTFKVEVSEVSEVRLYCKRVACEVPLAYGGFKFGEKYYRTLLVPTSEVPVIEVPFEAQSEVLIGLA